MAGLLGVAASGMLAQQLRMDIIANNLANVSTTGYKAVRAEFQDAPYELKLVTAGTGDIQATTQAWLGNGVIAGTRRLFGGGSIEQTSVATDLAIAGDGYFQVARGDGSLAYTRDGRFSVDLEGRLVTANGYFVEPAVNLPAGTTQVQFESDGRVLAWVDGNEEPQQIGQLTLARFANPGGMQAIGMNLLVPTAASGGPIVGPPGQGATGSLVSGALERSNVDVAAEMASMIEAQRAYQMSLKSVQAIAMPRR